MQRRKQDYEDALWAELSGVEAAIKELTYRRGHIAAKLQIIEIEKVTATHTKKEST